LTIPHETLVERTAVFLANDKNQSRTAEALGIARQTLQNTLKQAAEQGLLGPEETLPGYHLASVSERVGGKWIKQVKAPGEIFEIPPTHVTGKITVNRDADGRVIQDWLRVEPDRVAQQAAMRAVVDAFKEEIPGAEVTPWLGRGNRDDLLNLFAVTDAHFGMLSWREETGADWDLNIAEKTLIDWFAAAVAMAPPAKTAVFAQLGDMLHYDGFESKTPTSGHILDADSRLPKVVRVVIRTLRLVIRMLLEKHQHVHIIMADANHDPASEVWLREMFASHFESEPRVTVDSSASTYYAYEHGETSLFFHHGHKRKVGNVDSVFAGQFRDVYGRTRFSYAHLGHLHSDELKSTNLMKVERHETLAAADAYAANGGWLSGRSAKVITYSKRFGEVGRLTLTPEMVVGAAANDNASLVGAVA
jgi:hypothetical protein